VGETRGSRQEFYDNVDEYDGTWTWTDVQDPRHRLNLSVVWDVPVGRDRRFGSSMPAGRRVFRQAIAVPTEDRVSEKSGLVASQIGASQKVSRAVSLSPAMATFVAA